IDTTGTLLARATEGYPLATPRPGWTEQDPETWWVASMAALRRVTSELAMPVLSVGLAGQMHGTVFLDKEDRVIRPALLWTRPANGASMRGHHRTGGREAAAEDRRQSRAHRSSCRAARIVSVRGHCFPK